MKKRLAIFACAFLLVAAAVASMGAYLKYRVFQPYDLFQDRNIIELPFQLMADPGMRYVMNDILNPPEPTIPPDTTAPETTPDPTGDSADTTTPDTTAPIETTEPPTLPPPTEPPVIGSDFDFTQDAVGDEWFDNVLFIGDSRTCGLRDCARSGNADYFCAVSTTVYNVLGKKLSDTNFSEQTLESLLANKTYDKIFISLGINECYMPINNLMNKYTELVNAIRAAQPEAKIILQGIMAVSKKYLTNGTQFDIENIEAINNRIAGLTEGENIYYIDVNEAIAVDEGYLPAHMSGDGCHLYGKYYILWEQWIRWAVARQGL